MNYTIKDQLIEAKFLSRPNRFVLKIGVDGNVYGASLPNPGRMQELLYKDTTLLVTPMDTNRVKYPFRVVGLKSYGQWLMLDTIRCNDVAEYLINNKKITGLENYSVIRKEVTHGNSRFDLLLSDGKDEIFCEVKSCTLFHNKMAMFPDAVTERGKRHVEELGDLSRTGIKNMVLFLVHSSVPQFFMPDIHNDPDFSKALYTNRNDVNIVPVSIGWTKKLSLKKEVKVLPVRWDLVEKHGLKDSGSYLFLLENKKDKVITIGSLGDIKFKKGFYCYVGSAKQGLSKRVKRHKAKRKNHHWHIDYFRQECGVAGSWPIRIQKNIECSVAKDMNSVSDGSIENFGSSDCCCSSHLFYFKENPVRTQPFQDVVLKYRMGKFN